MPFDLLIFTPSLLLIYFSSVKFFLDNTWLSLALSACNMAVNTNYDSNTSHQELHQFQSTNLLTLRRCIASLARACMYVNNLLRVITRLN